MSKLQHPGGHSTNRTELCTPPDLLGRVREVCGSIALDPCGHPNSVVHAEMTWIQKYHRSPSQGAFMINDGLEQPWRSPTFANPPYSRRDNLAWAQKFALEARGGCEIMALVPASVGTRWFRSYWEASNLIAFLGRLTFIGEPTPAPFESALCYAGPRQEKFLEVMTRDEYSTVAARITVVL